VCDVVGTFDRRSRPPVVRSRIHPEDDVRVEDGDQRVEVASASSREECVDDIALLLEVGVGMRLGASE
jgi:hypothetical protein